MLNLSDSYLLTTLLEAQHNHATVKLIPPGSAVALSSTVLGFDYYEGTLLIDGLTPPVSRSLRATMGTTPFLLQLNLKGQWLNIHCVMIDCQYDLYTLKLIDYAFTDNQRWFSRVHFGVRQGPKCEIDIEHSLPVEGHTRNLSVHGAALEFYGQDIREQLLDQKRCKVRLFFNDLFTLVTECSIKKLSFQRQPSCHSLMRVVFLSHTPVSISQLEGFIDAFDEEASAFCHHPTVPPRIATPALG